MGVSLCHRRKKKCIRYAGEDGDNSGSDDDQDDASKVDSTTTDGDLESMGSPAGPGAGGSGRLTAAPATAAAPSSSAGPAPLVTGTALDGERGSGGVLLHNSATVTSHMSSSASSSTSSSSSTNHVTTTSFPPFGLPSARGCFTPVSAITPSRPGLGHPIEKLCGGSTPPPQLQRPPGLGGPPHPASPREAHRQYGGPSGSSTGSLAASSSIVPALIAT